YEEFWLFGGVKRGLFGRMAYNKRSKATLLSIIKRSIKRRTHIMSDMFATCVCKRGTKEHTLENNRTLQSVWYSHSWVSHSENFVDPLTETHTKCLDSYLDEYMWWSWFFPKNYKE
ncbi:hypothetical protein PHMEG_00016087, partial [Phytophthora megakarya]